MEIANIKKNTVEFREQKDSLWKGVGRRLTEKGIDIQEVIIADAFTEDVAQYYVLAITPNHNVYEFYFDFSHKDPSEGEIVEWHDFTNNPEKAYMHESATLALTHLAEL